MPSTGKPTAHTATRTAVFRSTATPVYSLRPAWRRTTTAMLRVATFSTSSSSWEDVFPRHSVLNPWSTHDHEIAPLTGDLALDKTTRHLLQLLLEQYYEQQQQQQHQQVYNDHTRQLRTDLYDSAFETHGGSGGGGHRVLDRATTIRCNRVIEALLSSSNVMRGKAARADEILQCMQLFYKDASPSPSPPEPSTQPSSPFPFSKLQQRSSAGTTKAAHDTAGGTSAAAWNLPTSSILTANAPYPTSATYLMVLRLFAADPSACPRRAHAIVEYMQQRYETHGPLDLQPNVVHWNQVLSCWAISSQEDKAYQAANLLQQLKRNGTRRNHHDVRHPDDMDSTNSTNNNNNIRQPHTTTWSNLVDISSYAHVLRACAKSDMSPYSKKLGAEIAIKVFKELRNTRTDLIPTTYVYTYYLQALAYLPDTTGSSSSSSSQPEPNAQHQQQQQQRQHAAPLLTTYQINRREVEALAAFQDSINMGCVNEYVLDNFRQAVSVALYRNTMGNHMLADHPTTAQLLKRLPARARRNAKSK